jgi:outer membrane protein assembly factor BamB
VVADATHIYFAVGCINGGLDPSGVCQPYSDGAGPLYRVPHCGGPVETVREGFPAGAQVFEAGDYLYAQGTTERLAGTVLRVRKSDGAIASVGNVGNLYRRTFAANGTHVYAVDDAGVLMRATHTETAFQPIADLARPGEATPPAPLPYGDTPASSGVALSGTRVAWTIGRRAFVADLDGRKGRAVFESTDLVDQIAISDTSVFVGSSTAAMYPDLTTMPVITEVRLATGSSSVVVSARADGLRAVGREAYWSDGSVHRRPLPGGGSASTVTPRVSHFDLYGARVYFDEGNATLFARPATPLPAGEPFVAATARQSLWDQYFGTALAPTNFTAMAVSRAGTIALTGETAGELGAGSVPWASGGSARFVAAYDAKGNYRWARRLSSLTGCFGMDATGAVVVSEATVDSGGTDQYAALRNAGPVTFRKLDPSGVEQWTQTAAHGWQCGVSPTGDVFTSDVVRLPGDAGAPGAGWTDGGAGFRGIVVRRMDGASGSPGWATTITGTPVPSGVGPLVAEGNAVYAYSYADLAPQSSHDNAFFRLDAATGKVLWKLPVSEASVQDFKATTTGLVILGATLEHVRFGARVEATSFPGVVNAFLASVDASGNVAWVHFLPNVAAQAGCLSIDGAGNLYVSGEPSDFSLPAFLGPDSAAGAHPQATFLARFDAAGQFIWSRQWTVLPSDPLHRPGNYSFPVLASGASGVVAAGAGAPLIGAYSAPVLTAFAP